MDGLVTWVFNPKKAVRVRGRHPGNCDRFLGLKQVIPGGLEKRHALKDQHRRDVG